MKDNKSEQLDQLDLEIAACEQAIRNAYALKQVEDLTDRIHELSRQRRELENGKI